jgi:carbon storage regulator
MLILERRVGQVIRIGDDIIVTVTEIDHYKVKLAIEAPRTVPVYRKEIWLARMNYNKEEECRKQS